jgi:sortase (surface protein transpeptidase)
MVIKLQEPLSRFMLHATRKSISLGILVLSVSVCLLWYVQSGRGALPSRAPEVTQNVATTSTVTSYSLPAVLPQQLRIPRIKLAVPFSSPLGLLPSGEVAVPTEYDAVGWYKYSPAPGSLGPAVVLGHVDSYEGPAVFFSLGQLDAGDDIFVDREDGSVAHFKVEKLVRQNQGEFPTEEVYGNIDHAGLRLITCSGIFDRTLQRYSHNLIVYARLVRPE